MDGWIGYENCSTEYDPSNYRYMHNMHTSLVIHVCDHPRKKKNKIKQNIWKNEKLIQTFTRASTAVKI